MSDNVNKIIENTLDDLFKYPIFLGAISYTFIRGTYRYFKYIRDNPVDDNMQRRTGLRRSNLHSTLIDYFVFLPTVIETTILALITWFYPPPILKIKDQLYWIYCLNWEYPFMVRVLFSRW
jgi:hypothetical protein